MAEILGKWLEAEAGRSSEFWGERDCLMFAANWILHKTGVDTAEPYRGRYKTERGCLRILKRNGGVRGIIHTQTAACGFKPTSTPVDGDLALIQGPALHLGRRIVQAEAGGIVIGERVAVMSPLGLLLLTTPILEAWKI